MYVRKVREKLRKENAMKSDPILRRHLPETYPYTSVTARKMIRKYPSLFIKPNRGSQGKGIIRLRRLHYRKIQISWGLQHREIPRKKAVQAVQRLMKPKRTYLIQQGLELAKYKNRIFDIRVYMQKPASKWFISGKVVRVAVQGRFLTNYSQGATPKTVEEVFSSIYKNQPKIASQKINRINALCLALARTMDRKFPGIRELGIDVGVDRKGYIWIIEANTAPQFNTFKSLSNKTMYKRIISRRRTIYS
ncbi:YheC/YheD family protein [Paenibacillus puerhi]|uniref:YheC/YheD family protein n=1 Tax=Paenibacillus puerhi TaxID=2692622 RepID=UPI001359CC01|nr:YheC/YheD family protein [Paenibacillus puerhi]